MGKVRAGQKGKYELSKHGFYHVYHYCLQYKEWKDEYDTLMDTLLKSAPADKEPGHEGAHGDPVFLKAEKCARLGSKLRLIEQTALEADPYIAKYILFAVTMESVTYRFMKESKGIPCGKNYFYDRRRRFYWLLAKKLELVQIC